MNSKSLWNDQIPEKDGIKTPVNDIAISPDGTKVIAAVGNRVLLYKADNGDLIESLRGHKDVVYSVSFSSDGSRFSSGIFSTDSTSRLRYDMDKRFFPV